MGLYDWAAAASDSGSKDQGGAFDTDEGGFSAPPSGLAGIDPQTLKPYMGPSEGTMTVPPAGSAGLAGLNKMTGQPLDRGVASAYAEGGAIPTGDEESPMMNTMSAQMDHDISAALKSVQDVFSYGRQLHGLQGAVGGEKQAGNMPTKPFSESQKPAPMMPPSALPYGPGEKPFGKRGAIDDGSMEVAGNIPMRPGTQSPNMPEPMMPPTALPYPKGQKPFGQRTADASEDQDQETEGAIPTDDEETA